jgi:hypothetical protein
MRRLGALALALLALAACDDRSAPDPRQTANPDKYARDRELCRAQVNEQMRNRRVAEDSSRAVFSGDTDRYGQGQMREQMANYGDTRTFDGMMGSCMESRGWSQPRKDWWQRLGTPHTF